MGLLDVLNGMQNGPRGPSTPSAQSDSGGGMSPMTMAILALLAWKGIKHFTGNQAGAAPRPTPAPNTRQCDRQPARRRRGRHERHPQGRPWAVCSRAARPAAS